MTQPRPGSENRPPASGRKVQPRFRLGCESCTEAEYELALLVKRVYTEEYRSYLERTRGIACDFKPAPRWDGHPGGGGPEDKPQRSTWLRIARWFLAQEAPAEDFIRRVFDALTGGDPPFPNQLISRKAEEAYKQAASFSEEELRIALATQKRTLETQYLLARRLGKCSEQDAMASVLLDEDLCLGALFRYCAARQLRGERFRDIAAEYRNEAAFDYVRNEAAYDAAWGDWVPDSFRSLARKIYEKECR